MAGQQGGLGCFVLMAGFWVELQVSAPESYFSFRLRMDWFCVDCERFC